MSLNRQTIREDLREELNAFAINGLRAELDKITVCLEKVIDEVYYQAALKRDGTGGQYGSEETRGSRRIPARVMPNDDFRRSPAEDDHKVADEKNQISNETERLLASADDGDDANALPRPKHAIKHLSKTVWNRGMDGTDSFQPHKRIEMLEYVVNSRCFIIFNGFVTMLNAALVAVETQYDAQHRTSAAPLYSRYLDRFIALFFSLDVALNFMMLECECPSGWGILEAIVVAGQVLHQFLPSYHSWSVVGEFSAITSTCRIFSVLRVFKFMGGFTYMALARELRMMTISVGNSFQSLVSSIVMLGIIIFCLSLYLTQAVTEFKIANDQLAHPTDTDMLEKYFGSLDRSMFSLYQCISDGVGWGHLASLLQTHISPWLAFVMSLYVAFSLMALLNVITGVFVGSCIRDAEEDQKRVLVDLMSQLFLEGDLDGDGAISWEEFSETVRKDEVMPLLKAIGMSYKDVVMLFRLLDFDDSGEIDPSELIGGCVHLQGSVKAIDFAAYLSDFWSFLESWQEHANWVEERLAPHPISQETNNSNSNKTDPPCKYISRLSSNRLSRCL